MMKHLTLSGCPFTAASIQCHPCPPTRSGGFSPDHGILLCQDRFFSKRHMEDTIVHEMIHAFDHCRFEVDWGNLRHHACSEVGPGRVWNSRCYRPGVADKERGGMDDLSRGGDIDPIGQLVRGL